MGQVPLEHVLRKSLSRLPFWVMRQCALDVVRRMEAEASREKRDGRGAKHVPEGSLWSIRDAAELFSILTSERWTVGGFCDHVSKMPHSWRTALGGFCKE